jgi:virulence-associated protein VagC
VVPSTVFTSDRSQAGRLRKGCRFPAEVHQVATIKIGHSRLIISVGRRWDDLFLNGPRATDDFMDGDARHRWRSASHSDAGIYAGHQHLHPCVRNDPPELWARFNRLAERLGLSSITLGELLYGAEKSAQRLDSLQAIEHFAARLEVLTFAEKAAEAHYGPIRAQLSGQGRRRPPTT